MQKANTNIERPYFICPAEQTGPPPLETFKSPWCCSLPRSPRDIAFLSFLREPVHLHKWHFKKEMNIW